MKCYSLLLLPLLVSAHNMAFPPQPDEPKLQRLSDYAVVNKNKNEYVVENFVSTLNNKQTSNITTSFNRSMYNDN